MDPTEQDPTEQDPSKQSVKEETEEDTENVVPPSDLLDRTGASSAEVSTTGTFLPISSNESKPPSEDSTERKSSAFVDIVSKLADRFKKRLSSSGKVESGISSNAEETIQTPSEPLRVNIVEPPRTSADMSRQKNTSDEDDNKRKKSALKRSEDSGLAVGGAPVKFSPDVGISNLDPKPPPRKSYNPFASFERNIPISNPKGKKGSGVSGISDWNKSYSTANFYNNRDSNVSGINERGKRSISVVDLSKQNIAFCFFPEEPDWDDDDDDDRPLRYSPTGFDPDLDYQDKDFEWSEREHWDSRLVYLIALISYSISFSNIYHFPMLVYTYSGYFLIPYTIFTIIFGYPLHFLESSLGQYSQSGPVKVWDCAPIARGVGWSMFLLCCFIAYYYNMYAAYSVIYFSRCFNTILPWLDCDESKISNNFSCVPRMCATPYNINQHSPAEHYFIDHVLRLRFPTGEALGTGLGSMMFIQLLGFFFAWFVVYVAIIQGVRSIGKCVYFLVALPYFVLLMMLTAGFMLKGSSQAWPLLFGASGRANIFNIQMWRSAAEQVFFELGICQGIPLVYGSYCHHRNPTHKDSAIICTINYFTSLLCALVLFNILGALTTEMGNSAEMVARKSDGLVFIMYSDAICRIPASNFWCIIFFLMLFSVIIGTQIGIVETIMTVIYDEFPNARPYRWFINLLVCCGLFLIGLVLCTSNGYFVVHMLDRMTGAMPRLPIAVFSVGAIVFIYGLRKFCEDVHFMIDYFPNLFLRGCFFITPFLLIALTFTSWVSMKNITIFGLQYYKDAINIGWFTLWFILIWIPIGIIYWMSHCYYTGQFKLLFNSLNSWGPKELPARIARTEFSSDHIDNFTNPWIKRKSSTYIEEE